MSLYCPKGNSTTRGTSQNEYIYIYIYVLVRVSSLNSGSMNVCASSSVYWTYLFHQALLKTIDIFFVPHIVIYYMYFIYLLILAFVGFPSAKSLTMELAIVLNFCWVSYIYIYMSLTVECCLTVMNWLIPDFSWCRSWSQVQWPVGCGNSDPRCSAVMALFHAVSSGHGHEL